MLTVGHIVQPKLLDCKPGTTIREAAAAMSAARCGSMVVRESGDVAGIWTERDALALDLGAEGILDTPISRVMSSPVKTIAADMPLGEAALRFKQEGVRHFLVTDGAGTVLGMVTQTDVVQNQGVEFFVHLKEVGAVMSGQPALLGAGVTVAEAAARMRSGRWDAVVVEAAGRFGILTERDIVRLIGEGRVATALGEAASFPLVTVAARDSLFHARKLFAEKRFRHLGVVGDGGELLGLVTYGDLLASIEQDYVRELQEALREQEERFRLSQHSLLLAEKVSETTLEGIMVTAPDGTIESVNPAFAQMFGYSHDELIGQNPRLFKSGRHTPGFYRRMRQALASSGEWVSEIWNRRKDGTLFPLRVKISAVREKDGALTNYVAAYVDISQQRQTLQGLRESEERLATLIEALPDAVFFKDGEGRWQIINTPAKRLFDLDGVAWRGKTDAELAALRPRLQEIHAACQASDERAWAQGGILHEVEVIPASEGKPRYFEVSKIPLFGEDGSRHALVILGRDATERREAEIALRRERDFTEAVLDTAGSLIAVLDRKGRVVRFNRTAERITGYAAEEVTGRHFWECFLPEEEGMRVSQVFERIMEGDIVPRYENHWLMKDGSRRLFDWSNAALRDGQGRVEYLITIGIDITERKRMEDELRHLNENLEQQVREEVEKNLRQERLLIQQSRHAAMGEMIGNIAHQWRQPLNALALLLANIKDAYEFDELNAETLDQSVEEGQRMIRRMSATIDDFRNFFRPNKKKVRFSVLQAVEDTLSILGASLKNHNILVTLEGEEDAVAWGYPNEYSQVLLNILSNAKEAILGRGNAEGRITIRLRTDGERIALAVRDSGGGIDEAIMAKIFDPYFTTKESGTGIGLYMSKIIVESNMNGRIEARNVEGGAEFTVSCPVAPPPGNGAAAG